MEGQISVGDKEDVSEPYESKQVLRTRRDALRKDISFSESGAIKCSLVDVRGEGWVGGWRSILPLFKR